MNTEQFKKLIEANIIKAVVFDGVFNDQDQLVWEVSAADYRLDDTPIEYGVSPGSSWSWHSTNQDEENKTFSTIDQAYQAVRKLGYIGTITIEG